MSTPQPESPHPFVPLNKPDLGPEEEAAVLAALGTGWVTGAGRYVDEFEARFAALCHRRHAVACSSGTTALWVALAALGIGRGGHVLMQSYTCEAAAHAAMNLTGRPPRCLDVDPNTWAMDARPNPTQIERWENEGRSWLAPFDNQDAVILAHTYGVPARDTLEIEQVCAARGIPLIEDASEAHGAAIGERPVGSFGTVSIFSCRGEKTISGGNLGVVLTDDATIARRVRQWVHNGLPEPRIRFWSTVPALNGQASHLNCALACAQLARIDELVARRRRVHEGWRRRLGDRSGISFQGEHGTPAWWLTAIRLGDEFTRMLPQDLGAALYARGIETRPGFYPIPHLPHLRASDHAPCPVAEDLFRRLLILPSGPGLTDEDLDYVCTQLLEIVGR